MSIQDAIQRIKTVAGALPDDDPDKVEMLNIEGDYAALMEWAIVKRSEHLADAECNKSLADKYAKRKKSYESKADSLKGIIQSLMIAAGENKFKCYAGTCSMRNVAPKPIVTDEGKIPDDYFKRVLDKTLINQAVKDGFQIDGVSMDNGGVSLMIRA